MSQNESDDIQKRVAELSKLRDRTGKANLTTLERIDILNKIYDGLLFFWQQMVILGSGKGTLAISGQLEAARLEMYDLQRTGAAAVDKSVNIIWGEPEQISSVEDVDA